MVIGYQSPLGLGVQKLRKGNLTETELGGQKEKLSSPTTTPCVKPTGREVLSFLRGGRMYLTSQTEIRTVTTQPIKSYYTWNSQFLLMAFLFIMAPPTAPFPL